MQTSGAEAGEEVMVGRPEFPAATARKRPWLTASATAALVVGLKRPPRERFATAFPMRPLDLASLTALCVVYWLVVGSRKEKSFGHSVQLTSQCLQAHQRSSRSPLRLAPEQQ